MKQKFIGSADLNAVFYGPRREESNCGGLDTPSSSSSIGNGSSTSGSLVKAHNTSFHLSNVCVNAVQQKRKVNIWG